MELSENCKCGKQATLWCASCKLTKYCSPECQRSDWKLHKVDCQQHRDHINNSTPESAEMILSGSKYLSFMNIIESLYDKCYELVSEEKVGVVRLIYIVLNYKEPAKAFTITSKSADWARLKRNYKLDITEMKKNQKIGVYFVIALYQSKKDANHSQFTYWFDPRQKDIPKTLMISNKLKDVEEFSTEQ